LLERQFPIENSDQRLQLKSAKDYADRLSVHVNYLNKKLKESTGKPLQRLLQKELFRKPKYF
jgi:hypothetical protein